MLARYVGGHLALGGYADVDVRPWRDDAAPPPEEAAAPPADAPVKDLRAFLARRGAPTPRGAAEKADLRAACAAAAGLPRVVAWDAGVATTRGEVLGRADLRLHENRPDAALAAACDLVLVCVAGDDAAGGADAALAVAKGRIKCFVRVHPSIRDILLNVGVHGRPVAPRHQHDCERLPAVDQWP